MRHHLFQFVDIHLFNGADSYFIFGAVGFFGDVGLVENCDIRDIFLLKNADKLFVRIGKPRGIIHHKNGDIGAVEYLFCLADTHFAESSHIVETRCINYHDRTERKKLHSLSYGVGGSALNV